MPDETIEVLDTSSLSEGWQGNISFTRTVGDQWLTTQRSLALAVPSVVLPDSTNVLLNPTHPRAKEVRILDQRPFAFDPRLRPVK